MNIKPKEPFRARLYRIAYNAYDFVKGFVGFLIELGIIGIVLVGCGFDRDFGGITDEKHHNGE